MAHLFYNQLRNARIKNIALGVVLLLMNALMLFVISLRAANGKPTNTFYALLFTTIIVGLVFLIALVPFGQVLESQDKNICSTFYKLGPLKFNLETWGKVNHVTLEQDSNKYYRVTIKTESGQTLVLEKHTTLDMATIRLNEFKKLFG